MVRAVIRRWVWVWVAYGLAACSSGNAIHFRISVAPELTAHIAKVDVRVTGTEPWSGSLDVSGQFADGEARWIYRPVLTGSSLKFSFLARDTAGALVASAVDDVEYFGGVLDAFVQLDVVSEPRDFATLSDLATIQDLAMHQDLPPADMAHIDMAQPADMAHIDMAQPADMAHIDMASTDMAQPADMAVNQPVAGMALWLKSSVGVTTSGANVTGWADQSGNSLNLSQTTASLQPTLVSNVVNGYPVIRFDGTDDYLNFSAKDTAVRTVFVVQKWAATAGDYRPLFGDDTVYPFHGSGSSCSANSTFIVAGSACASNLVTGGRGFINGTEMVVTALVKPTASFAVVDIVTTGAVTVSNLSRDRSFADRVFYGDIAEVLIYNTALSDTDRIKTETYLKNKYGL